MDQLTNMNRARFLRVSLGGAAATALITACGGDDDGGTDAPNGDGAASDGGTDAVDAPPSCLDNGTTTTITGNHGHALLVSMADVQAGTDQTYDIQGVSIHGHSVTLTAAHFAQLAQNQTVQVTSTVTGHSHVITVACV